MPTLNERAWRLCDAIVSDAELLGVAVSTLDCGTRLIDCGVKASGGIETGRRLAEVCMSGSADVNVVDCDPALLRGPAIRVQTSQPVAACMASQYAGWEIKGEKFFAMGSGPMRAAAGREELFDHIGNRERPDVCVGVLETGTLPPDAVCVDIASKCGVAPDRLTLLVARTASAAGTLQIVARSIETALHKLHVLEFDLARVESASGTAPLPPVAADDMAAIGLTNDAILYGGAVDLTVRGNDATLKEIGPRVPSSSSPDFGRPFGEIFARYEHDFYRIDPMLFSPAVVRLRNVDTGNTFSFGQIAPEVLAESFAKK
ncbi:MAG: methenyltetrahydromethanopterin cyclohydrolase [Planctomycetes bacterium]|nr:methenyltetrahydromethanopterin cyclohydrolase [Planctomycetota bacterium]